MCRIFRRAGLAMLEGQWQKLGDVINKGLKNSDSALLKTTTVKFSGKGQASHLFYKNSSRSLPNCYICTMSTGHLLPPGPLILRNR